MRLYMAVTADEFELPIAVEAKTYALANRLSRSRNSIIEELSRNRNGKQDGNGRKKGYLLREVEVEDW